MQIWKLLLVIVTLSLHLARYWVSLKALTWKIKQIKKFRWVGIKVRTTKRRDAFSIVTLNKRRQLWKKIIIVFKVILKLSLLLKGAFHEEGKGLFLVIIKMVLLSWNILCRTNTMKYLRYFRNKFMKNVGNRYR